jgi:outer membrane protein assembly factor BamB
MEGNMMNAQALKAAALTVGVVAWGPAMAGNWPTFAGSAQRLGTNANETILTVSTVPNLKLHWAKSLSDPSLAPRATAGAPAQTTSTQPLYIEQVATVNGTHDEVFQTTNAGIVAALNAATGHKDWEVELPLSQAQSSPCVPVGVGIRGTPTIDPVKQLLYVVDGNGALHALNIGTGVEAKRYPVQVIDSGNLAMGSFNHSSPTLVGAKLFVTTSGRPACEGVASPYHGGVIAFNRETAKVGQSFFPVAAQSGGGGIWGPGGAMYDPVTDQLFVATGNALAVPDYEPLSESAVSLSRNLKVMESDSPGPPVLTAKGDYDFGSTPTPVDAHGCPPLLAALNKTGNMFVWERKKLGAGPSQVMRLSSDGGHGLLVGMAAYDPATQMLFINNPLSSEDGSVTNGGIAMQVTRAACTLGIVWQTTYGTDQYSNNTRSTDPMIAGGVVWFVTGEGKSVLAFNEMTGAPLWSSGSTLKWVTSSPVTVEDGQMFVQSGSKLYAFGL